MQNIIENISRNFQNGNLHVFSAGMSYYLYIRSVNRFFEIDEVAHTLFASIRHGFELPADQIRNFLNEWTSLDIESIKPRRKVSAVQVSFSDMDEQVYSILERINVQGEDRLANMDRLEIVINISRPGFEPLVKNITKQVREIWDEYRIRMQFVARIPLALMRSTDLEYFRKAKIFIVPQFAEDDVITVPLLAELGRLGIQRLELFREDLNMSRLPANMKNFVRVSGGASVEQLRAQVQEAIYDPLSGEPRIPEPFQNILMAYNFLTTDTAFTKDVVNAHHSTIAEKTSRCSTCWARNACWSAQIYETFGDHPFDVNRKPENCQVIQGIFESLIDVVSCAHQRAIDKSNTPQEFDLQEDGVMKYVNP